MLEAYPEESPCVVDPRVLPLRRVAPCWANGRVETTDYDNKDGVCVCRYFVCHVDWRNRIQFKTGIIKTAPVLIVGPVQVDSRGAVEK
jgi:hypothetical protein